MCKCTPEHEVHPQPEEESILGHFLLGGLDLEVYLNRSFFSQKVDDLFSRRRYV